MIPLAAIAPYWNRLLLSLSLLVMRASIRSSHQQSAPPIFAPGGRKHSIYTVDVATSPQHVRKQQTALLFSRKSLLSGTSPAGSPHDQNERARIHSVLQDLRNTHPHDDRPNFPTTTSSSLSPTITLSH
jgi:hypothetical protein